MPQRILVVDDEPDMVEMIGFNLKAEGYEVITAATGLEALNQAREKLPDLILLDLMLPELDGMAVCEILQQLPSTASIPVIMVTAWKSQISRLLGLASGAQQYITKPFSPRDLVTRVNSVLQLPGLKKPLPDH